MKWDMHTSRGMRNNNEDAVGVCFLREVNGIKEYVCELEYNEGFREKNVVVLLKENKIISADGKKEYGIIKNSPGSFHIFAVADGLGGHLRGEIASEWAIKSVLGGVFYEYIDGNEIKDAFVNAYNQANEYIKEHAKENSGTTLVVAVVLNGNLYIANVGDSRAYVFRNGKIVLRTKDHTFVQSLVDAGVITDEEAKTHPRRNVLLKALGMDKSKPDVYEIGEDWDSLLLCSDGFSDVFTDEEIANLIREYRSANEIVELAIKRGSDDNVSVVLVKKV